MLYSQNEEAMILFYENINSFIQNIVMFVCVCVWEREREREREKERERERESDYYEWHHLKTDIFRALLLCSAFTETWNRIRFSIQEPSALGLTCQFCWELTLTDWQPESKNFRHYVIFWCSHIIPNGTIHVIRPRNSHEISAVLYSP